MDIRNEGFAPGSTVRHRLNNCIVEVLPLPPMDEECFAGRYLHVGMGDPFGFIGRAYNDFILKNFEEIESLA